MCGRRPSGTVARMRRRLALASCTPARPGRLRRRLRDDAGQTATEYVGMLLIVSVIVAAVFTSGLAGEISRAAQSAICAIGGGSCEPAAPVVPAHDVTAPGPGDADGDGASDARERELGLDPNTADSDGDGVLDGDEVGAVPAP